MLSGAQTSGVRGGNFWQQFTPAQWTVYSNAAQEFDEQMGRPGFFTDELGQRLIDTYDKVRGGDSFLFPFALYWAAIRSREFDRHWPSNQDEFARVFEGYLDGSRYFSGSRYFRIGRRRIEDNGRGLPREVRRVVYQNGFGNSLAANLQALLLEYMAREDQLPYAFGRFILPHFYQSDNIVRDDPDEVEFGLMLLMDVPWNNTVLGDDIFAFWGDHVRELISRKLDVTDNFIRELAKLSNNSESLARVISLRLLLERGQDELAEIFYGQGRPSYKGEGFFKTFLMHLAAAQEEFTPSRIALIKRIFGFIRFTDVQTRPLDHLLLSLMAYVGQTRPNAAADARVDRLLQNIEGQIEINASSFWNRFRNRDRILDRAVQTVFYSGLITSSTEEIVDIIKMTRTSGAGGQTPSGAAPAGTPPAPSAPSTPAAPAAGGAAPSGAGGASSAFASTAAPLWEPVEITYADGSPITYAADDEAVEEWQAEEWITDESVPEDDASLAELGWAVFSGEAAGMGVALPF